MFMRGSLCSLLSCEMSKLAHTNVREIDEVRASILAEVIKEDFLEELLKKNLPRLNPHS